MYNVGKYIYPDFILILSAFFKKLALSKFYPDFIVILLEFCLDKIKIKSVWKDMYMSFVYIQPVECSVTTLWSWDQSPNWGFEHKNGVRKCTDAENKNTRRAVVARDKSWPQKWYTILTWPGRLKECAGKRPIFHHTLAAARWPLGYRNVRLLIN